MFQIIICDDDIKQVNFLEKYIKALTLSFEFEIHTFNQMKEMIQYCRKKEDNYIFLLDIMFREKAQGILGAKYINEHFKNAIIIYVSAYLEKACDVYDTKHCYFIYKPQFENRIKVALEKAVTTFNELHQMIYIPTTEGINQIYVDQILYIERIKRYSIVHCDNSEFKTHLTLNEIVLNIPNYFIQCHKCLIVNLKHVEVKQKYLFQLSNHTILPISRSFAKKVDSQFQQYLMEV